MISSHLKLPVIGHLVPNDKQSCLATIKIHEGWNLIDGIIDQ